MSKKAEWYVIQVISGTEENVKRSLFQRRESLGMEDYIIDVYVPTHDVVSVRAGGQKVKKQRNLLPGYILVNMVVTNESWYIVRNTPNVTGFLGAGNIPVPVSGAELEQLKGKVQEKSETFETKYRVGDTATIIKGPFEGNDGVITGINDKKGTVKLNINILGRDTPIELEFLDIKV
ncbi:transcription termination/antitermination factor NusG [Candidatus Gracilibacteria bacterium HOT-871]|nr:transcription termination/antitermination factor NusG [Candidatus Gracilibacteria bacterium HOT-871]MBB1564911.1 transcription termination/antitermination factor NusG [Candidatus Gracilibacteria bacterium]MBF0913584.1 transcription termination/antitermination factor NusG [Candidatus Gracilibacteria bacterium]RKW23490.1 MAG: transcription termination/antitermination factor NusG [Candidatus Gracilibacteria bacterium]RKW24029.1 MAG: transcription termination/antitermination factor NusG [Candida